MPPLLQEQFPILAPQPGGSTRNRRRHMCYKTREFLIGDVLTCYLSLSKFYSTIIRPLEKLWFIMKRSL